MRSATPFLKSAETNGVTVHADCNFPNEETLYPMDLSCGKTRASKANRHHGNNSKNRNDKKNENESEF